MVTIREVAQRSLSGKLLKWIFIWFTLTLTSGLVLINIVSVLPGAIIIIITIIYLNQHHHLGDQHSTSTMVIISDGDLLLSLPRVLEARKARMLEYCLRK